MRTHSILLSLIVLALIGAVSSGVVHAGQASGGAIEGHVRATGPTPANPMIRLGADPKCAMMNRGSRPQQELIVRSADGGIGNVFVAVQGNFPKTAPPKTPVTLDQKNCLYRPRVVGAQTGQTLQVTNSDPLLHNVHSTSSKLNVFDVGQPQAGMVFKYTLKGPDVLLHIVCDVHSWMNAYVGVVNHPYFAVSGDDGAFKIAGVPPGKYTLQAWHEQLGPLTTTVEVKAGQTATADFKYTGSERPRPPAGASIQEIIVHEADFASALGN
jgi:hypothetical protein